MKYPFTKRLWQLCGLFLLFYMPPMLAQNRMIGITGTAGYDVANSPKYTKVISPSFGLDIQYLKTSTHTLWGRSLKFPLYGYALSFQTLGNANVLGNAIGVAPILRFNPPKRWKNTPIELGLGLAYMSKVYDRITNPQNTVVGSQVSFYARAKIEHYFTINSHLKTGIGLGVSHYSNGNFIVPNLGVNIPALTISFLYNNQKQTHFQPAKDSFQRKLLVLPFVRASLGATERELTGPKYAVYTGAMGLHYRLSRVSRLQAGMEYIFNSSPYYFMKNAQFYDEKRAFKEASRLTLFLGHEFLFGHFGFLGEGGIYLNRHYNQKSLFSTKLGFQYYPLNALTHPHYTPFVGLSVRAYFGEAEFVELSSGIYF
jgi:hypothetical protein